MYEITVNNKFLYHPASKEYTITNAVLHQSISDSGYLDITIPPTNPLYEDIKERGGKVTLYKDNSAIWWGTIRDVTINFQKCKSIYVVGEMVELNDTVQEQKEYNNTTKYSIFAALINNHNAMVEPAKQFEVGIVYRDANKMMSAVTNWDCTLDAIRNYLCSEDEFVRIRRVNNTRYVDIVPLDNYGKRSLQYISFGQNLLDYTEKITTENVASICIPLGATLENSAIEGYDNYLTCAAVNNNKVYVENQNATQTLGRITKVVHFDELETPQELLDAANNWLNNAQFAELSLSLTAVDLSMLDANIDDYKVGDYIRAICEPFGMDSWLPVRERETDLLNISNNKITVGAEATKSITKQQAESIEDIQRIMPTKGTVLDLAKRNATNMLNSAGDNGHVVFKQNNDGVVTEILIMDTSDISTARKIWKWNENGFGYSDDGGQTFGLAMTMDGAIVADYITTGQLIGLVIDNGNGTFHVDSNGHLKATDADIQGKVVSTGTNGTLTIQDGNITGVSTSAGSSGSAISLGGYCVNPSDPFYGQNNGALYGSRYLTATLGSSYLISYVYDIVSAYSTNSDERIKKNITELSIEKSKALINNVKVHEFDYIDDPYNKKRVGVIAQEIKPLLDEIGIDSENNWILRTNEEGYYRVEYEQFIPHLINCIQDLQKQIDELKKQHP